MYLHTYIHHIALQHIYRLLPFAHIINECSSLYVFKNDFNNYNLPFSRNYPINDVNLPFYQVWCQLLHVLTHYFTVCNYAWMFCEGFYLHALMVIAFTKERKLLRICYGIGWS